MIDSQTHWIWAEHAFELHETYVCFRKTFNLKQKGQNAQLLISGDSRFRLYVNGHYVAYGPARSYPWQQCVESHDIGAYLNEGDNIIAVSVYQPGYSHFSYVHRAQAGLLAQLTVDEQLITTTDTTWKALRDSTYADNVQRISIYGAGQEHRDLRQETTWKTNQFDDQQWPQARICAGLNQPPWENLQITDALQYNETIKQCELVQAMVGSRIPGNIEHLVAQDPHKIVTHAINNSNPIELTTPTPLPTVSENETLHLCYDHGSSQICSAHIELKGAQGGEMVLITYFEKGTPDAWVISDPNTYCHMRMTDRYILAKGDNTLEPFTPRGGRFILLTIVGPVTTSLQLKAQLRPRQRAISLLKPNKLEDRRLNEIATMCWRTISGSLHDTLMDCPWREQAHWTGDGAIGGRIIAELCGDTQPLLRMLELATQDVARDGILPSVTPSETHAYVALAYNFSWIEALTFYTTHTNDDAFLVKTWAILTKMLDRFHQDLADDGLIRSQPGRRFFLDWAEISSDEPNGIYNLRYLFALQLAGTLATRLDRSTEKSLWHARAETLSEALRTIFYRDNIWYDQHNTKDRCQQAATFLVLTELLEGDAANALMDQAVNTSLESSDATLILSSPYMHYYLFEALDKLNRKSDILAIIKHRWGKWLDQGAVTTWENWEIDFPDGSACHGWSSHPLLYIT